MPAPEGNTYALGKGRPTSYKQEYDELVYNYCLLGATDKDLAGFFGVAESTLNLWKETHESFSESLNAGKAIADGKVAQSLFQLATGYSHPDTHFTSYEGTVIKTETTKHYPPSATAQIFWLKNRQKKFWRDKVVVENEQPDSRLIRRDDANGDIVIETPSDDETDV